VVNFARGGLLKRALRRHQEWRRPPRRLQVSPRPSEPT
jgi:hypothetical protein